MLRVLLVPDSDVCFSYALPLALTTRRRGAAASHSGMQTRRCTTTTPRLQKPVPGTQYLSSTLCIDDVRPADAASPAKPMVTPRAREVVVIMAPCPDWPSAPSAYCFSPTMADEDSRALLPEDVSHHTVPGGATVAAAFSSPCRRLLIVGGTFVRCNRVSMTARVGCCRPTRASILDASKARARSFERVMCITCTQLWTHRLRSSVLVGPVG
jgi:hypothetical protein